MNIEQPTINIQGTKKSVDNWDSDCHCCFRTCIVRKSEGRGILFTPFVVQVGKKMTAGIRVSSGIPLRVNYA
jgi:hypothetical protein